ncbi:hypothetical protein [Algoriphagus sp. CAU 1675]|uniref:hypothetical protein n=1 Tax=Algoriphagus sp. CAU 1675 TaxID=3032597 RepID=UPI0023DBE161|nr:hypothetical protein [Algoriphagus sp. CAU 1675]MDF2159187.1 hypothetical protein [Algoriphagus sp. CAU 1675]
MRMKKYNLILIFLITGFSAIAQSGLSVKAFYGISGSSVARKVDFIGIGYAEMNRVDEFGILVSKSIGTKFRISSGIGYTYGEVKFSPSCPACFMPQILYRHEKNFKMISIPVYLEYSIGKALYFAAGPVLDFQQSEWNNFSDQSGIGYLAGIGAKVPVGDFVFSLFPNYKRHGVIPFEDSLTSNEVLQEFGLQFGVGYSF